MDISTYRQTDLSQLPCLPLDQRQDLPDVPAVYFALGEEGEVLYIGKAVSLQGRWISHHRQMQLDRIGNVRLAWIELESQEFLEEVEQTLIEHFGPVLNGSEVLWNRLNPIMLRIPPDVLERIDHAARRIGINRTAFFVSAASEKAEKLERAGS
jgi:hypothetical protein